RMQTFIVPRFAIASATTFSSGHMLPLAIRPTSGTSDDGEMEPPGTFMHSPFAFTRRAYHRGEVMCATPLCRRRRHLRQRFHARLLSTSRSAMRTLSGVSHRPQLMSRRSSSIESECTDSSTALLSFNPHGVSPDLRVAADLGFDFVCQLLRENHLRSHF